MSSIKEKAWLEEYLSNGFNATEAARSVGYKWPNKIGPAKKQKFAAEIQAELDERSLEANEVLAILSDQARGDMADFIDIEPMFFRLNLAKAQEKGLTHLIKKVRDKVVMTSNKDGEETETHYLEIELYDAQSAADKMARVHGAYKDQSLNVDLTQLTTEQLERIAKGENVINVLASPSTG